MFCRYITNYPPRKNNISHQTGKRKNNHRLIDSKVSLNKSGYLIIPSRVLIWMMIWSWWWPKSCSLTERFTPPLGNSHLQSSSHLKSQHLPPYGIWIERIPKTIDGIPFKKKNVCLVIQFVTFLGMVKWPPIRGSKGHGLDHLVFYLVMTVIQYYSQIAGYFRYLHPWSLKWKEDKNRWFGVDVLAPCKEACSGFMLQFWVSTRRAPQQSLYMKL